MVRKVANNLPAQSSILYLDQNVIRYVTNLRDDNPGVSLGRVIDRGVEIGALICPFSHEHFWETSAIRDDNKRRAQLAWLASASRGASFLSREELVAAQLIALVRPKVFEGSDFFCEVDVAANEAVFREMKAALELKKKETQAYFSDYNLRRKKGRILKNIPGEVRRVGELDVFFRGIADCIACHLVGHAVPADRPFGAEVLKVMIDEHGVQRAELEIILDQVISTKGHCAPLIRIQSKMHESWMLEQKEMTHNDVVDLHRISTALPYADILVVDAEQRRHLESTGLPAVFGTKVFSLELDSLVPLCDEIVLRIRRRMSYLNSLKT